MRSSISRAALYASLTVAALSMVAIEANSAVAQVPAPGVAPDQDERLDWWREARFGLFIHWGLYSIPAGAWQGNTNHAEWIRTTAQIPVNVYDRFVAQFNPVDFNADDWVRMAKDAGMKYIVITSKHHDGFCLWDSALTDYDVMSTPFQRDILKELADACERGGIRLCFYHSIMDWHHPDYLPRRGWEEADRPIGDADFDRFVAYLHGQVTELLTGYGDVGVMWFDGEWERTWNHEYGQPLYDLCRELKPDIIVNDRVDVGRQGHSGQIAAGFAGDYATPEQNIPGERPGHGRDWETCMTMNRHWGFNEFDHDYKSTTDLIRKLIDIASKGGNFLLNVGPTAQGTFPEESQQRLREIGAWMGVNGESIYGTEQAPLTDLPWGRATMKRVGENTTLYLHVFDWPRDGRLTLEGLGTAPTAVELLASESSVSFAHDGGRVIMTVPDVAPDEHASVVSMHFDEALVVYSAPRIDVAADRFVESMTVGVALSSDQLEARYTLDGSTPHAGSPRYDGPIEVRQSCQFRVRAFRDDEPMSGVSEVSLSKVRPNRAYQPAATLPGLVCTGVEGDWDVLPDFSRLTAGEPRVVTSIDAEPKSEFVARQYVGLIDAPSDAVYQFLLRSDDGSRLFIDGQLVVNNDGLHGPEEKRGLMALARGWHWIVVEWFNKTGGADLQLRYAPVGEEPAEPSPDQLAHQPSG